MIASLLILLAGLGFQDPQQRVAQISASAPELAESITIGSSEGGQPITAVKLSGKDGPAESDRPGILILAGAHGTHRLGSDLAIWQMEKMLADYAEGGASKALLDQHVVYVIPLLNPDGRSLDRSGNAAAMDLDRDGKTDEDGHDDLNGDSQVSQMRWLDPEGEWLIDAEDPRLMRKADPSKGERGLYMLAVEARDNDGDEERSEDASQGVQVHRNFSHRFDEFDRSTGPFPMSEPESRALADFLNERRHISLAFVYGPDNNLLGKVTTDKPKPRVQLTGYLEEDKELFEQAGEIYRELTGREGDGNPRHDGSPWSWLYFQLGATTFANDVWQVPTPTAAEKKDGASAESTRLAHCDSAGAGFVAWTEVDHPDLGKVEVGGFVQGQDWTLMPAEGREELFDKQHQFFSAMIERLPKVQIASFTKKVLPGGAFELEAAIENSGRWSTLSAQAERTRRFSTPRLKLNLGGAELLAGRAIQRCDNLAGLGGRQTFKWIVSGNQGLKVRLQLEVEPSGKDSKEVTL